MTISFSLPLSPPLAQTLELLQNTVEDLPNSNSDDNEANVEKKPENIDSRKPIQANTCKGK